MAEDSRTLIRNAFDRARESGRRDWFRMTLAVLKNRLLDLTDRSFKETDYGTWTFLEFVRLHNDIIDLDETIRPPIATLRGAAFVPPAERPIERSRVRSDLWRAVLDFSSGEKYFWDHGQKLAVMATGEEPPGPQIPTITVDTFAEWKTAFAKEVEGGEPEGRLAEWVSSRRPSNFLPIGLRHEWNGYLKAEVRKHLVSWFLEQGLEPPADLLVLHESVFGEGTTRSEDLRRRLIACLRSMSTEELERVQIPATVLLRLKL